MKRLLSSGNNGPAALVARWRSEATLLRAHGAAEAAATKVRDADELEAALKMWELEELTITEAAKESGYSASRLRRLFPGRRRVPRSELPRKPQPRTALPDLAQDLLNDRPS